MIKEENFMIPIVVLNYNDFDTANAFLRRYIEELKPALKDSVELIFVDNASTDGSYEILKSMYENACIFIRNESNIGYGAGNNEGLRYIKEHMKVSKVIICNPDIIISADTIKEIGLKMEEHKDVAIIAPKMIMSDGNVSASAWKRQGIIRDGLSCMIVTNKIFKLDKKLYREKELNSEVSYVDVINGSMFMADFAAFESVGFFDEDTFLYCEENILSYKLRQKGYKELLVNNLSYIHAHNATIGKVYRGVSQRYKMLNDSRRIYYRKYLKIPKVKMLLFNIMAGIGLIERKFVDKIRLR